MKESFHEVRPKPRGFELYAQFSYVATVLTLAAWREPVALAIVGTSDGKELNRILEEARKEYDALDRIDRIGRNRRRLQRRRSVA